MKNINLFLDLSLITQNIKNHYIECLISIVLTFLPESSVQLLISTSSGAKHMFSVGNPTLLNSWENIHKSCKKFITGGFTNDKARRYFEESTFF